MTTPIKPIISILLLTAALTGCGGGDKPAAGPGAAMPPPEVDVITVVPGRATLTQDLPGQLQAYRTAQVRARVDGVVEKRLFQEGSDVKAGASLFQIDARTYRAADASAKADLVIARQNVERYKPLLEIRAVSQQEFDLAAAKAKQAESASIVAAQDLENASVPAAISGRIGRAHGDGRRLRPQGRCHAIGHHRATGSHLCQLHGVRFRSVAFEAGGQDGQTQTGQIRQGGIVA